MALAKAPRNSSPDISTPLLFKRWRFVLISYMISTLKLRKF
jgi:hypothetical protein